MFAGRADLEVASAGLSPDAEEVVTPEILDWAERIFVMENVHRARLQRRFGPHLRNTKIVCLDIADEYDFMDAKLVEMLELRAGPHLRRRS